MRDGTSLRDQQAEFTKQLLLEAARKVIIGSEPEEFTMQKVAAEAGVSHRTIYRYFPSRQALIDEFSDWMERQFRDDEAAPITSFHNAGQDLQRLFRRFDRHSEYFEAAARLSGGSIRPKSQAQRTARLRSTFDQEFPDLDPRSADEAFAILRFLTGLQSWYTLRDRFGLRDGETGAAVAWAADALINALDNGIVPDGTLPDQPSATSSEEDDS